MVASGGLQILIPLSIPLALHPNQFPGHRRFAPSSSPPLTAQLSAPDGVIITFILRIAWENWRWWWRRRLLPFPQISPRRPSCAVNSNSARHQCLRLLKFKIIWKYLREVPIRLIWSPVCAQLCTSPFRIRNWPPISRHSCARLAGISSKNSLNWVSCGRIKLLPATIVSGSEASWPRGRPEKRRSVQLILIRRIPPRAIRRLSARLGEN